jgi:hypothetical protein
MIAYTTFFQQNFAFYLLEHSRYKSKYVFWMFLSAFLNLFYLNTYPYANTTLTNIVYVTFIAYQLGHNLFKFSF